MCEGIANEYGIMCIVRTHLILIENSYTD